MFFRADPKEGGQAFSERRNFSVDEFFGSCKGGVMKVQTGGLKVWVKRGLFGAMCGVCGVGASGYSFCSLGGGGVWRPGAGFLIIGKIIDCRIEVKICSTIV